METKFAAGPDVHFNSSKNYYWTSAIGKGLLKNRKIELRNCINRIMQH